MANQLTNQIVEQLCCMYCEIAIDNVWKTKDNLCQGCYDEGIRVDNND